MAAATVLAGIARHERARDELERTHLGTPGEQHRRLQDVERLEADACQVLFHLSLGA